MGKDEAKPLLDKDGKPAAAVEESESYEADDSQMKGMAGVVKKERPPEMESTKPTEIQIRVHFIEARALQVRGVVFETLF